MEGWKGDLDLSTCQGWSGPGDFWPQLGRGLDYCVLKCITWSEQIVNGLFGLTDLAHDVGYCYITQYFGKDKGVISPPGSPAIVRGPTACQGTGRGNRPRWAHVQGVYLQATAEVRAHVRLPTGQHAACVRLTDGCGTGIVHASQGTCTPMHLQDTAWVQGHMHAWQGSEEGVRRAMYMHYTTTPQVLYITHCARIRSRCTWGQCIDSATGVQPSAVHRPTSGSV